MSCCRLVREGHFPGQAQLVICRPQMIRVGVKGREGGGRRVQGLQSQAMGIAQGENFVVNDPERVDLAEEGARGIGQQAAVWAEEDTLACGVLRQSEMGGAQRESRLYGRGIVWEKALHLADEAQGIPLLDDKGAFGRPRNLGANLFPFGGGKRGDQFRLGNIAPATRRSALGAFAANDRISAAGAEN